MGRAVFEFGCTELLMTLVHGKTFNTMECVDQFLSKETLKSPANISASFFRPATCILRIAGLKWTSESEYARNEEDLVKSLLCVFEKDEQKTATELS